MIPVFLRIANLFLSCMGPGKTRLGGVATDRKRLGVEVESMEVYGSKISVNNDGCFGNLFF